MPYLFRLSVFARNEAHNIVASLCALLDACPSPRDLKIFVLINGCTDRTPQIVEAFAKDHPEVIPVILPFGDKCNAWNTYVHELADDSPVHFFTDGDVLCSPGALSKMQQMLLGDDKAMAIAGVPKAGRHKDLYLQYIIDWHWLFGNLYAVKTAQLGKIRSASIRLPLGLCGNDHFITKCMAARSFNPMELDWRQNIYHPDAGYCFESLKPYRFRDWRIYWKRRVTYALRQLQIPELDDLPLSELPPTMDAVNRRILARLEAKPPKMTDLITRAVRRRLRKMYPTPEASYYDLLLPQSNHRPEISVTNLV